MDQAILRRGPFDHVIKVEQADEREVEALSRAMSDGLPKLEDIDTPFLSSRLIGRLLVASLGDPAGRTGSARLLLCRSRTAGGTFGGFLCGGSSVIISPDSTMATMPRPVRLSERTRTSQYYPSRQPGIQ